MSDLTDNLRTMSRNFLLEAQDANEWRDKREDGTVQHLRDSAKICSDAAAEIDRLVSFQPQT